MAKLRAQALMTELILSGGYQIRTLIDRIVAHLSCSLGDKIAHRYKDDIRISSCDQEWLRELSLEVYVFNRDELSDLITENINLYRRHGTLYIPQLEIGGDGKGGANA